ncbi:N(6)-adenine-specific methyltransferase METTL4 [Colossoma macropomum]|uniref:N(6)-adenine-specific methyltransferase METTL4 n=1 Tax=Colossoma macropomum TaxID=42526 RepID=UPI001864F36C|nr:N(6)-adenine-specific methyltransferase METTL4 [Colossoma macropomum]
MAVLFANDRGWLLDSCSLIDEGLERCFSVKKGYFRCRFNEHYYDLSKPHIVDKDRTDVSNSSDLLNTETPERIHLKARKKRKRKRSDLNQGELDAQAFHEKFRLLVLEGSQPLIQAGHHCGYLTEALHTEPTKQTPVHVCQLAALCDMAKQLLPVEDADAVSVQAVKGHADLDSHLDLFSRLTENHDSSAREVTLMGEIYFLPPRSRFLLSDFTRLEPLVNSGEKFDLIVLDPPWENKSVKRSNRYGFLPSSQLKQLPVPVVSAAGCVVVTWVTNRPRHLRFVREELYPHWGVKLLAEWLWVKVTRTGEFVFPLDSPHKKPYEVLLLGRFCANSDNTTRPEECEIPDERLIISIPSALHSQKPSLSAVLRPYIRHNARCLEMFARSLQPDWTSWGNEVIKFQHHSYFTTESMESACDAPTDSSDTNQQVDAGTADTTAQL